MPKYVITMTVEAARSASVQKKLKEAFGKDCPLNAVEKLEGANTRAARLDEARSMVEEAVGIVEELKEEMESWRESIPENLQGALRRPRLLPRTFRRPSGSPTT